MSDDAHGAGVYRVPTYHAPSGTIYFHFLHGHVPNHQIDFIYRPEIPQGALLQQHFSHLSRLMKYIEPQPNHPFAFAIGNLSRDDTQHEPGHGGLGLIFSMRISGVTDHAGRQDPTFAHAGAMIGRHMDEQAFYEALTSFYSHLFGRSEDQSASALMYRNYVELASSDAAAVEPLLKMYLREFDDLPQPSASAMQARWLANEAAQPKRVVIVHPNQIRFRHVARCAARIAAMLYASNIRWTSITNGREADLENGITIRMVSEAESGTYTSSGLVLSLAEVPEDEASIAQKIFSAKAVERPSQAAPVLGWRARYEAERGMSGGGPGKAEEEGRDEVQVAMPESDPKRNQRVIRDASPAAHAEHAEDRSDARNESDEHNERDEAQAVPSDRARRAAPPPVLPVAASAKMKAVEALEEVEALKAPEPMEKVPARSSRWALWLGLGVLLMGIAGALIFGMNGLSAGPQTPEQRPTATALGPPAPTATPIVPLSAAPMGKEAAPAGTEAAPAETSKAMEKTGTSSKKKKGGGAVVVANTGSVEAPAATATSEAPKATATAKPKVLGGELDLK